MAYFIFGLALIIGLAEQFPYVVIPVAAVLVAACFLAALSQARKRAAARQAAAQAAEPHLWDLDPSLEAPRSHEAPTKPFRKVLHCACD